MLFGLGKLSDLEPKVEKTKGSARENWTFIVALQK